MLDIYRRYLLSLIVESCHYLIRHLLNTGIQSLDISRLTSELNGSFQGVPIEIVFRITPTRCCAFSLRYTLLQKINFVDKILLLVRKNSFNQSASFYGTHGNNLATATHSQKTIIWDYRNTWYKAFSGYSRPVLWLMICWSMISLLNKYTLKMNEITML